MLIVQPRIRPPLDVKEKPFRGDFSAASNGEKFLRGIFGRQRSGRWRLDLFTGDEADKTPSLVNLWDPETARMLHITRQQSRWTPVGPGGFPHRNDWSYVDVIETMTDEKTILLGMPSTRVVLKDLKGQQKGFAWVCFDYGVVMQDEDETGWRWNMTKMEKNEGPRDWYYPDLP